MAYCARARIIRPGPANFSNLISMPGRVCLAYFTPARFPLSFSRSKTSLCSRSNVPVWNFAETLNVALDGFGPARPLIFSARPTAVWVSRF